MVKLFERMVEHVRLGENARQIVDAGVLGDLGRTFVDPYKLDLRRPQGFLGASQQADAGHRLEGDIAVGSST